MYEQNNQIVHRLKSMRYLLKQLKPYTLKMVLSVVCGLLKEVSIISAVGICAYMAAMVKQGKPLSGEKWLALLFLCVIMRGVCTYLESYLSHDVAYHALVDYRLTLYKKFIGLCPDILLQQRSGQVSTTLMNDVEQLEWFYGHTVGYTVVVAIVCTGVFIYLFRMHPLLGMLALLGMILIILVPMLLKKKADEQGMKSRHLLGEANSVTLEGLNGMNEILTLNWRRRYKEKNRRVMQDLTDIQVEYAKRMGFEGGLLQMAAGIAAVVLNLAGIWLTFHGRISMEQYAVVGTTVWLAFNPLLTICGLARTFGTVFAASERVMGFMEKEPVLKKENGTQPMASGCDIEFSHVKFRYTREGENVLKDVSFTIPEGCQVALIGESGAGKTTCTSLLDRLWDVQEGSIRIGGQDIRDISLKDLRKKVSLVLQDVYLFNTTILENIRLGNPQASEEQVREAAVLANIHDFIMSLPMGYDTVVGERGVLLSGGQKQRISIARALLKDAPILVMDEAVSSLDTQTDLEIQNTIRKLGNKTVLMAAHRYSTIKSADMLIVMHKGEIVQQGTLEELMNEEGYFRTLFSAQVEC